MLIPVECPECRSRFQLNDELRGRRIRCPNVNCKKLFRVPGPDQPPPAAKAQLSPPPPEELLDWRAAPPPLPGEEAEPTAASDKPRTTYSFEEPPPRRTWLIAPLLLLATVGLASFGAWYYSRQMRAGEDAIRAEAESEAGAGKYRASSGKFRQLSEKFGSSSRAGEYRLLADLYNVRDLASRSPAEPGNALSAARDFADRYSRDPAFKTYKSQIGAAALAIASQWTSDAAETIKTPAALAQVPGLLDQAAQAIELAERFPAPGGSVTDLKAKVEKLRADTTVAKERQDGVNQVLALLKADKPDLAAVDALAGRLKVAEDAAIVAARREAEGRVYKLCAYEPINRPPQSTAPASGPPSLLLDVADSSRQTGDVVLTVARGLLTALDSTNGRRLWAMRVGPDVGELPLRVPGRGEERELVIVPTAEPPSLTACDARTGEVRWHQPLEAPALGRPALNAGRLFVPTLGPRGIVYDLDARSGLLRGKFETGMQLAAGCAFDPLTGRLYVPARSQFVYVLGYAPAAEVAGPATANGPRAEGLLPTLHAPGSLRGEPIVVSGEEGVEVPRYLVLGVTDGLDAMKLRAFRLLDNPAQSPPPAEVSLPGWSWFPPYHDPEKVVLVTDAGALGLFGLHQAGTSDPPIFPLLGKEPLAPVERSAARGLLVHAEEFGFWSLAGGRIQHWRLGLTREQGRVVKPVWPDGARLGSPLHAAQVSPDRSMLYLVTQSASPPLVRASAVDSRSGRVNWQQPLGLSPQGDPWRMGGAVYVLDPSGAIDRFDPAKSAKTDAPWQSGGERIAPALDAVLGWPIAVHAADGSGVTTFTCTAPTANDWQLVIRAVNGPQIAETRARLPGPLGGTPAVAADAAIVPIADGTLVRVSLGAGEGRAESGPNWRPLGATGEVRGHVLPWQDETFLVSDGGRKLVPLHWPAGPKFDLDSAAGLQLPARIATPPVRLSGAEPAAIVADSRGALSLIQGAKPRIARTWNLGGSITAGPWVVDGKIACVVGRKNLVWIDAEKESPLWSWTSSGDGIEFAPTLMDGSLVVGDSAGLFAFLDPATGKPRGESFRHPAEVAPSSAAVPFGPGRLFAPLTDGTALLLPLSK